MSEYSYFSALPKYNMEFRIFNCVIESYIDIYQISNYRPIIIATYSANKSILKGSFRMLVHALKSEVFLFISC